MNVIKQTNRKHQRINSIKSMHLLMCITKVLALQPCGFEPNSSRRTNSKRIYALHSVVLIGVIIILNVGTYYYKSVNSHLYSEQTVEIVEAITAGCLMMLNVTPVLSLNFWNRCNYETFLVLFVKIDAELERYDMVVKGSKRRAWLELFLTQGLFVFLAAYDNYLTYSSSDLWTYWQVFATYFQRYHMYVHYLTMYYFIASFQVRFKALNVLVGETLHNENVSELSQGHLRDINRMFLRLCENVDSFNALFGISILLFIVYALASLLLFINYLIYHNTVNYAKVATVHFLVAMVMWSTVTLIMGVVLAKSADGATKEVRRTSMLCFKLAHKLQVTSGYYEEKLKDNLTLLAQEASATFPHFTAAGFFDLDYSMLFTVLNMITSYLVVLIQFHK